MKAYLHGLHWDGVERLDRWLSTYLGAADTEYSRAVGSRWLISVSHGSSDLERRPIAA